MERLDLEAPIACTLGAGDYTVRQAWIADLNRKSLKHQHREDLKLELVYDLAAKPQVLEMVEREQECCAFLTFVVSETGPDLRLTIEAPERARGAAETVFMPFSGGSPAPSGCGCRKDHSMSQTKPEISLDGAATTRIAGATAVLAGTSVLACGACCVLPFALPAAAMAMGGGAIGWLASLSPLLTPLALIAVVAAWGWVGVQTYRARRAPSALTLIIMSAATLLLTAAITWPHYEDAIIHMLRR